MPESSSNIDPPDLLGQLWEEVCGEHGLPASPLYDKLRGCESLKDMCVVLEKEDKNGKEFRKKGQKVIGVLKPVARLVGLFLDAGAEAASTSGHAPGGKAIFAAFGVLLAAAKGVSKAYDALEELLSNLREFFERLETYLTAPSTISPALKRIVVETLKLFVEVIALCTKRLKKVGAFERRFKDYSKALFGDTKIQYALEKLNRLTSKEQRRLLTDVHATTRFTQTAVERLSEQHRQSGADLLAATSSTNMAVERLGEQHQQSGADLLEATHEVAEDVAELRASHFDEKIKRWLSLPETDCHDDIAHSCPEGTGDWFFSSPEFLNWKTTKNGMLCIYGKVGSGKSVLFASIVSELRQQSECAYFYFDFRDKTAQTVRGLLVSLIFRMASCSQECHAILKSFYEKSTSSTASSKPKLFECLERMLRASAAVHILIDALDECPEDIRHHELLPLLKRLVALKLDQLRLLVTTRPEADITECLSPILTHQLSLHDVEGQARTLAAYVEKKVATFRWPDDLKVHARDVLVAKAGGMFIWVHLQLESLRRCHSLAVRSTLDFLPLTLNSTYERILESIPSANASLALRIFECVAFAVRPLAPDELAEVFAFKLEPDIPELIPEFREEEPEHSLLSTCSSFIEIVAGRSSRHPRKVQFAHFSAQEYLLSARLSDKVATYRLDSLSAHTTLAKLCLATLNTSLPLSTQPLGRYSVSHWMVHVKPELVQEATKALLSQLLHSGSVSFSRWLEKFIATKRHNWSSAYTRPDFDKHTLPLYVAAWFGLRVHVRHMLDSEDARANVLEAPVVWAAVAEGNIDMVSLLLEQGADVNAPSKHLLMLTPLDKAVLEGNLAMTSLLLRYGAEVDLEDHQRTPLHLAVRNGHRYVEIVRLLIEWHAPVNARDAWDCTPLNMATRKGLPEIARLLLERGAYVDARDENGCTPLYLAALGGRLNIARLLVEQHAVVDAPDEKDCTPLHVAARQGYLKIVRLLLQRGANADARDQSGRTPLYLSAEKGYLRIIYLLVERHASVDVCDEENRTPLHVATREGRLETARFLLDQGALVNACDDSGRTALHFAAEAGRVKIVQLLLERGANVTARDTHNWAPVHMAMQKGYVEIVALLIGLDVRGEGGCTPLHTTNLAKEIHDTHLLFEHGALLGEPVPVVWLYSSFGRGSVDDTRHLLPSHNTISSGWTVLHGAALRGNVKAIRFLIEHGADIEQRSHAGRTALLYAAGDGKDHAVRALLDYGANVLACDTFGLSALDHALGGRHVAVVRLLLERGASIHLENAPFGSSIELARRTSRASQLRLSRNDDGAWDRKKADNMWLLLRENHSMVDRRDVVLHRLRRFRSVGSWRQVKAGDENGEKRNTYYSPVVRWGLDDSDGESWGDTEDETDAENGTDTEDGTDEAGATNEESRHGSEDPGAEEDNVGCKIT